jgi:tRNA(Ile)-lysidine synthetase-like protein
MQKLQSVLFEQAPVVIGISGGVDSIVLAHLVAEQLDSGMITLAHFDHGIRSPEERDRDRAVIESFALQHHLRFRIEEARPSDVLSEASARNARYAFLKRVAADVGAKTIMTAHHQDDLIETAIINIIRGTGPAGLSSLGSRRDIMRPLLAFTKADIVAYAQNHQLQWHEDSTNIDQRYLRNYVRHSITPHFNSADRASFVAIIEQAKTLNEAIHTEMEALLAQLQTDATDPSCLEIDRLGFILLEHKIACALVHFLMYQRLAGTTPDKRTIDKISIFCKTARRGARLDLSKSTYLQAQEAKLVFCLKSS